MAFRRFSSWRFLSAASSTGRLTQSEPDGTVSNSLLLRCLASCLSDGGKEECVQETHQGCPASIKSIVFRMESSENLHSGTKNVFHLAVSFLLSTERYTPALLVQRQKLSTFMELPAYRVVIMPYGVHERLRSHRGVDLTGKPRDLAFVSYHYRTNWKGCQGAMSPSRPACRPGALADKKGDGQSPSPQRVKKAFSPR